MKTIFLVLATLCLAVSGFAQKIKPLTIGDTINDNVIKLIAAKPNAPGAFISLGINLSYWIL